MEPQRYRPLRSRGFAALVVIHILVATAIVMLCSGCSRKIYTPVERTRIETRTDTVTRYIAFTDSASLKERIYESDTRYDSIAPVLDSVNRIIGWERWHFRERTRFSDKERERMQAVIDSMFKARHDTVKEEIPVPYEVERPVEVEKPLTWWQRFRLRAFPWLAAVAALLSVWTLRKPLMRLIRCILKLIRI